jgi:ubiquinone biosynthesis protein COQ4
MMTLRELALTANAIQVVLRDSNQTTQIHVVEETTGRAAFRRVLARLSHSTEGRALLAARPELSSRVVDFDALRRLPRTTLGGAYVSHLDDNGLSADLQASITKHVDDPDIAYLMRRFRQTHDVWHPLTNLGAKPHEEVTIHAFSYGQLRLPVSALIVSLGGIKHGLLERRWGMLARTFPQAYRSGREAADLMGVHWETMWNVPIDEVRRRYRITPIAMA